MYVAIGVYKSICSNRYCLRALQMIACTVLSWTTSTMIWFAIVPSLAGEYLQLSTPPPIVDEASEFLCFAKNCLKNVICFALDDFLLGPCVYVT